ncbi:MAG: hypothetical protein ABSG78_20110 [Verrucomicrobiota bacterium]|jgi:hypothetical protein
MKTFLGAVISIVLFSFAAPALAQTNSMGPPSRAAGHSGIDGTSRFIFYSVLEGLYEDGLSSNDVERILMKGKGGANGPYLHFIYACPICTATIWALEAYRDRPKAFYSLKNGFGGTFGPGLSDELHQQLYSDDIHQRLMAINSLEKTWLERRMTDMNLSGKESAALLAELEKKRQQGSDMLKGERRPSPGAAAGGVTGVPDFYDLEECAICNGAVGKGIKLPEPKGK